MWYDILLIAYYVLVTVIAIGILMENRNPMKTAGWVLVIYLVPVGGLVFYLMFGQNHRKRKLFSRKGVRDNIWVREWEDKLMKSIREVEDVASNFLEEKLKVVKVLYNSDKSIITFRNKPTLLRNGEEAFPEMLKCITEATHHIHVEYYIVEDDEVGRKFRDALIDKAKRGVEVRFIYDDVGSSGLKKRFLKPMQEAGIEVRPFMPVLFPILTSRANYRDHRKILIIDGKVGFLGGINLSFRYTNDIERGRHWRDTHLKIEGDAVKSLQMNFFLMWKFVTEHDPEINPHYFPETDVEDVSLMQIAASGPDSDWSNIMGAFFAAINSAREEVLITTPYLIPNDEILLAIQTAALSGVKVKIILPAKSDNRVVQAAVLSYVKQLLSAGVEVYLYEKGFIHAKTMVVDDRLCTVGTSNMDYRSFDINFEINAMMYDPEVTEQLRNDFYTDLKECRQITLERWERRVWRRRISESLARLVAPLL
ncbi:cardiolipin synthase [Phaeocystidibacter luteus]|uniref:Cardiolipin synthase n=1 Tax=Phaeocystidibacter luteus TaxID=911197 RepID=A0A6N6RKT2_9FLAO|nr:cardiolipin synthase [Phaeocystidibacter luteus]KAB2813859.1 cardiolipin synthase [Phaeocystidibacter luteus]